MSKFDLRDISQRLSGSKNADALVSEFLGYLQAVRSDWRATLAFYEVSRDALVSLSAREQRQGEDGGAAAATTAAADFQERIRRLNQHTVELADENQAKAERLQALTREIELLDQDSSEYQQELAQVKDQMQALEEQSAAATEHLNDAYAQLNLTQERMTELERTVGFLKDVFQAMALEHDRHDVSETLVDWFSEHFNIERCSLMVLDPGRDTLRIAAQRGIDPGVAARVRVRLGQGIAGWVAQNRKPLFVRV